MIFIRKVALGLYYNYKYKRKEGDYFCKFVSLFGLSMTFLFLVFSISNICRKLDIEFGIYQLNAVTHLSVFSLQVIIVAIFFSLCWLIFPIIFFRNNVLDRKTAKKWAIIALVFFYFFAILGLATIH